jgi:hypothetical protein
MLYLIVLTKPVIGSAYEKKMSSPIIWSSVSTSSSRRTEFVFQRCWDHQLRAGQVWHGRSLPCVHTSLYLESSCYSFDTASRDYAAKTYHWIQKTHECCIFRFLPQYNCEYVTSYYRWDDDLQCPQRLSSSRCQPGFKKKKKTVLLVFSRLRTNLGAQ